MNDAVYMLGVGSEGANRLHLLNSIYGPTSRRVLRQAGLGEGTKIVELACGTGLMTRWIGEQTGATGRVVAIDASNSQLELARSRCVNLPQISFLQRPGSATGLEASAFDIVYLRLLLMHLPAPGRVLEHARALLRPGGTLVCEEAAVASTFCDPPRDEQQALQRMAVRMGRERDCDYNIARRLHSLLRSAGFDDLEVSVHQPVYTRGPYKHLEVLSFSEALAHWRGTDAGLRAEGEVLCEAMRRVADDSGVAYGLGMMVQVQART